MHGPLNRLYNHFHAVFGSQSDCRRRHDDVPERQLEPEALRW